MRIPVGNFGNVIAPVAPSGRNIGHGPLVGDAMVSAGNMLSVEARQMQAEEEAKRREAEKIKANMAVAKAKNDLADMLDEIDSGMSDGSIAKTDAEKLHAERSQKLMEGSLKGIDPEFQGQVRMHLDDAIRHGGRTVRKHVAARDQQDIQAGIVSYMEQMQRYAGRGEAERQEAMRNVEAFLQTAGPQAGMKAQDIAKQAQAFKEGVTLNWLDMAISQNAKSSKALAQIQKDIAEDKFPELDPAKRTFLENKIMAKQQHLLHVSEVAERRRMTQLERGERRLAWYVENGMEIPPQELAAFDKASKGTPFEGAVQMIMAEQKAVADFSRLSPNDMMAKLNELKTSYGATPSKEQATHLAKIGRFVDNSIKLLRESPLTFATQREGAVVQPLDFAKPQEWESNLAARTGILLEQSKRNGTTPKGLFPQEAAMLSKALKDARPDQAAEMLATLRRGFGDDKVFRATMQQIAPDNPVVANAGIFAARGLESTKDRAVADLILRGNALLRPDTKEDGKPAGGKLLPMPKEEDMQRGFASYERNAYAGKEQARNVAYQTAKAIYAAKASEQGDYSGDLNSRRWAEAMSMATGKVESHKGSHIVMPYGMDYGTFKDGLKTRSIALIASGQLPAGFTPEKLRDLPLENAGDGKFFFRVGDGYLAGKDGRPVLIDFNQ
jgi:hypothetical protein